MFAITNTNPFLFARVRGHSSDIFAEAALVFIVAVTLYAAAADQVLSLALRLIVG